MYTSPGRVVRDGRLVAFAGETMTDEEARARGLAGKVGAKKKPVPRKEREAGKAAADGGPTGKAAGACEPESGPEAEEAR